MNTPELFLLANQTLHNVIRQIQDDQMDLVMPDELSWRPNQTVRAEMNIYAYENKCVPLVLAGEKGLVNNGDFKDDLLGEDPQGNFTKYHEIAKEAVLQMKEPEKIVHISYGDVSATQYLKDITIQKGLGAYDLATFIGADTTLPDDLVKGLWEIIEPIAEDLRTYGVFKAKIDVPEDAPLQQRLLGLTGRDPKTAK